MHLYKFLARLQDPSCQHRTFQRPCRYPGYLETVSREYMAAALQTSSLEYGIRFHHIKRHAVYLHPVANPRKIRPVNMVTSRTCMHPAAAERLCPVYVLFQRNVSPVIPVAQPGVEADARLEIPGCDPIMQMAQQSCQELVICFPVLDQRILQLSVRRIPDHGRTVFLYDHLRHITVCHGNILE